MPVQSKSKGNTFERKISIHFSERFANHVGIESSFRRNLDSGSFFGATNQKRIKTHDTDSAQFGDIITPTAFKYGIECKAYKTAPAFASIIKQEYKLFDTWLSQAKQDAKNAGKMMLLIVKFNNVPEFVVIEGKDDDAIMYYKDHAIIALDKWLSKPDSHYFD